MMTWALITHPDQFIRGRLVVSPKPIIEACVPAAMAQGWIVLARDSEVPAPPRLDLRSPWLSNPRRHIDVDHWREEGA